MMQYTTGLSKVILSNTLGALTLLMKRSVVLAAAVMALVNSGKAALLYPVAENDSIVIPETVPAIIPLPQQYSLLKTSRKITGYFVWTEKTPVIVENAASEVITPDVRKALQDFLKGRLAALSGQKIGASFVLRDPAAHADSRSGILLRLKKTGLSARGADKGAYSLQIGPQQVVITAADRDGFLYGLISLLQLGLHDEGKGLDKDRLHVPCWQINDQPGYNWRGVMLDESRHFFGKAQVKKLLDWMAYYKLNYFHWHLTDEPGWRIQIKAYPKLTSIGGIGNKTDSTAPAKYYTQADIEEIVRYAADRSITVIPEVDMPGHATAANRAYPENSGKGEGKFANFTFNPGRDSTYGFLTTILRETRRIFGVDMVHLGGDEVSFGNGSWGELPAVRKLMEKESLQDNKQVEAYFLRRMADSALQFNKKVLTWDEGVDAGLNPRKTIIFWWRHDKTDALNKAMTEGYDVVMCPRIPLYFDFVQDSIHKVGRKWAGAYASLQQVFDFYPPAYTRQMEQRGRVLGIQANLWTETVHTDRRLDFMLFPRMAALAAAAWTRSPARQYDDFKNILRKELTLYIKDGLYFYNPFDPASTPEPLR